MDKTSELEQPFPLSRKFYSRMLPVLILFLGVLAAFVWVVVRQSTEDVYLDRATRTAETIAFDISRQLPVVWQKFLSGEALAPEEKQKLKAAFESEHEEYRLAGLKVYDLDGRVLFSHNTNEIGEIENGVALDKIITGGGRSVIPHYEPDGSAVFELYVPLMSGPRLAAVFELYEPVDGDYQSALRTMVIPIISTLLSLLALLTLLFFPVINRAQNAISDRTYAIINMRRRLEKLVSRSAVADMRLSDPRLSRPSRRTEMTVLFSDIRGFTPYCEGRQPENIVKALNRIFEIQIKEIERQKGDVDKFIGDAVLACFEGPDRHRRATIAAMAIQIALTDSDIDLEIGIGLYSGPVVIGVIGTGERSDHTVIGDTVNIAARLCSAADKREIVGDAYTIGRSQAPGFSTVNDLRVKGRAQSIAARTWNLNQLMNESTDKTELCS